MSRSPTWCETVCSRRDTSFFTHAGTHGRADAEGVTVSDGDTSLYPRTRAHTRGHTRAGTLGQVVVRRHLFLFAHARTHTRPFLFAHGRARARTLASPMFTAGFDQLSDIFLFAHAGTHTRTRQKQRKRRHRNNLRAIDAEVKAPNCQRKQLMRHDLRQFHTSARRHSARSTRKSLTRHRLHAREAGPGRTPQSLRMWCYIPPGHFFRYWCQVSVRRGCWAICLRCCYSV